jgi:molecular chaperone DnaJ
MNVHARDIPDPYAALGVAPSASAEEIKRSYRRLARECHPDSTGGDKKKEKRFKEISSAYGIVGDPQKRAQYDAMREATVRGGPGGIPEGIFDLGDLFAQVFRGGGTGGAGGDGSSFRYQAFSGDGDLGGAGFPGFGSFSGFPFSPGSGAPRPRAATKKTRPRRRAVTLSDGSSARVRGLDIHSDLRVFVDEAILGTAAAVATVDGKATVRVPPGTSSGVKLRLKGKGIRGSQGKKGDHLVTVHLDVPKHLSDEATRLLVQFMDATKKG